MKRAERPGSASTRARRPRLGRARAQRKTLARNPRDPGSRDGDALPEDRSRRSSEGREPPSSAREARDVLAVIEAAYRSAETGQRVELSGAVTGSASATSV